MSEPLDMPTDRFPDEQDHLEQLFPLLDLLARCHREARERIARATMRHGMTESEFHLLWVCQTREQAPSQSDVAHSLGISPAQVSCLVEQLRKRDWISGTRCAIDRRRQVWQLTPAGSSALDAAVADLQVYTGRLLHDLSEPVRQSLVRMLHDLYAALDPPNHTMGEAA